MVAVITAAYLPTLWLRLLWAIPIIISTFAGVLSYAVAKSHLTFYDAILYWAERAHWEGAIEFYSSWLIGPLAVAALGFLTILAPPGLPLRNRWAAVVPAAPIVVIATLLVLEGGRGTHALPEQFKTAAMIAILSVRDPFTDIGKNRGAVDLALNKSSLKRHIFLVVDESVRPDFIDLDGLTGVTPYLQSRADQIADFGYAVSGSNCSLFSNLILRYGGTPDQVANNILTNPSLWSYARAAGFHTVYLDGQETGGRLQNGMTVVERQDIDTFEQFDELPAIERDLMIAQRLIEISALEEPHFVFVNKRGVHFPYARNYPREAAVFSPEMAMGEPIGKSRERLLNSYRNSVYWGVDVFFQELFAGDLSRSVILYTSDHGQNLMDRGFVTHCNSSNPHFVEGLVPLLAWSGDDRLRLRLLEAAAKNRGRATHFHIFPTLLSLFEYEVSELHSRFGASLFDALPRESRRFSFGPIVSYRGRLARWHSIPDEIIDELRQDR